MGCHRKKHGYRCRCKPKCKRKCVKTFNSTYKLYDHGCYYSMNITCCNCGHEFDCHRYLVCPRCGTYMGYDYSYLQYPDYPGLDCHPQHEMYMDPYPTGFESCCKMAGERFGMDGFEPEYEHHCYHPEYDFQQF